LTDAVGVATGSQPGTGVGYYSRLDDDHVVPGELAVGPPWLANMQHGAMISALMARAVDAASSAVPMQLTRLTVDMSRPIPLGPTQVVATVVRDGRRLQTLDVEMFVAGEVRARATALRLRVDPTLVDPTSAQPPWPDDLVVQGPAPTTLVSPMGSSPLWETLDSRWEMTERGEATVWVRLAQNLVDGEPLTPTVRAALAADLTMTSGAAVSREEYLVINPDLTLTLTRPPDGEWIRIASRVRIGRDGTGHTEGVLSDQRGWVGRSLKSLLVERR
jgi:hypothetical protein